MSKARRLSLNNNSSLQQNFIVENAFKRNKRYLNLSKIKQIENQYQANRRRPFSSSEKSVDEKISSSFMDTTAAFSDKVEQQIGKFKLRMSGVRQHDDNFLRDSQTSIGSFTSRSQRDIRPISSRSLDNQMLKKKKIRGMALDKYCSRQQYYQSKSKPILDQRLFNNYSEQKADLKHIKDFQKYMERDLDFSYQNFNDIEYNTQKLYQNYYYKKTTMQCNFNYKTQKITPRKYFDPRKQEHNAATELSPDKVKQSFEKCTVLKPKNIDSFYANTGKQLPSQLDMRFNNKLTNYWVDNRGKQVKKTKQYSLRKMKSDLVEAKIQEIKQKKRPKFDRNDLCDQKYFRVYPHF